MPHQNFLVSNYATTASTSGNWWRGYQFRVSNPINVISIRGGMSPHSVARHLALYESSGVVPAKLIAHGPVPNNRGGSLQITPVQLAPNQDYIIAQGSANSGVSGAQLHFQVLQWSVPAMISEEAWLDHWYPLDTSIHGHQALCWEMWGDPQAIIGRTPPINIASNRANCRPDLGLIFETVDHEIWAFIGGWKKIMGGWPKIDNIWRPAI